MLSFCRSSFFFSTFFFLQQWRLRPTPAALKLLSLGVERYREGVSSERYDISLLRVVPFDGPTDQ